MTPRGAFVARFLLTGKSVLRFFGSVDL